MLFSQFHLAHIAHCWVVVVNQIGLFFSQYSSQLDNCGCSPKSCLFSGQYSPQFVWGNVVILVLFISQPFPFKSHGNSTLYAKVKNISLQNKTVGCCILRQKLTYPIVHGSGKKLENVSHIIGHCSMYLMRKLIQEPVVPKWSFLKSNNFNNVNFKHFHIN